MGICIKEERLSSGPSTLGRDKAKLALWSSAAKDVAALVSIDEFELLQQIEDYIDIEDAKKAFQEFGETILFIDKPNIVYYLFF